MKRKTFTGIFLNSFIVLLLTAMICSGTPQARNIVKDSKQDSRKSPEWRIVRMRVTAYCPCRKCCGEYADGVTASGHKIQPGEAFVAADSKYPFGTEMIVHGYNNDRPVKVLDRGGVIEGNRIDVFFPKHQQALNWGVKYINVKVRFHR